MEWFRAHRAAIGILPDSLTFGGGLILARDALVRLKELNRRRLDERFRKEFPRLKLTDDEWDAAVAAMRWTVAAFSLIVLGFLLQLGVRLAEL